MHASPFNLWLRQILLQLLNWIFFELLRILRLQWVLFNWMSFIYFNEFCLFNEFYLTQWVLFIQWILRLLKNLTNINWWQPTIITNFFSTLTDQFYQKKCYVNNMNVPLNSKTNFTNAHVIQILIGLNMDNFKLGNAF